MHKVASLPPLHWKLYLKDGIPVVGSEAANMKYAYEDEDEKAAAGYIAQPDMPVYSAKIQAVRKDNTTTSPIVVVTDEVQGTGKTMELTFTSDEIILLLSYITKGYVPMADGWMTVRFTFTRHGSRVFPKLSGYPEA